MKKILKGFMLFSAGFVLMSTAHFLTRCESFDRIINPPDDIVVDEDPVKQAAKDVESAFLLGDVEQIKSLMHEQSVVFYSEMLDSASTDRLFAFGNAFKTRKLEVLSDLYAEYHFTDDKFEYSVAFAWQSDDKWVLTRF